MGSKYLSTGQAARLCSVTPDTILKWIRSGRLQARRTPGGHHRIARGDLDRLMAPGQDARPSGAGVIQAQLPRFCWEFQGKGRLLDGCRECIVYELRAQRCYEVVKLAPEVGHRQLFCETTCEACDYFQHVSGHVTTFLVVSDDDALVGPLQRDADMAGVELRSADDPIGCSALVQSFRPDFAVVDCALGRERSSEITTNLARDPRLPFVRIILAGSDDGLPVDCDNVVFARIGRPFSFDDLAHCAFNTERGVAELHE